MASFRHSTRRAGQLVEWIAYNDNNGDDEGPEAIAGYISVTMLAHVYNVPARKIADEVFAIRHPAV